MNQKAREYGGSAGGTTDYQQIQSRMQAATTRGASRSASRSSPRTRISHANAWLTKARAADAVGQARGAIEAYEKYLELRPEEHG